MNEGKKKKKRGREKKNEELKGNLGLLELMLPPEWMEYGSFDSHL